VIIAAVALVLAITSGGKKPTAGPKASTTPKAAKPTPTVPAGKWEYIGTRATDSAPLTMHELFPSAFASARVIYYRASVNKGTSCGAALIGSALQAAVKQAGCTQAVRATYGSRVAKVMATIGVYNLTTADAASTAATQAGRSEFVAQLRTKTGFERHIGEGTGIEEALVKGHYLVLVWAEFIDLRAPKTSSQRARLESFMNLLVANTVNEPLSYRMVDGKPMPAASPAG
jgi:hypothetical protein